MASKGKKKLRKHEAIFNENVINLNRFVYDAIVRSLLKLTVPQNCITRWDGPENDYGSDNFWLVMSRLVIANQILHRYEWNKLFESHYKKNGLKSSSEITSLLNEAASSIKVISKQNIAIEVQILISAISELVIFFYSKSLNLQLKNLAKFWVDYLIPIKKRFEQINVILLLYNMCYNSTNKFTDIFNDVFISNFCLSYEESTKDKNLDIAFLTLGQEYEKFLPQKLRHGPVPDDLVERCSLRMRSSAENLIAAFKTHVASHPAIDFVYSLASQRVEAFVNPLTLELVGTFKLPLTPQRAEDSQIGATENTGLGIRPHEELLRDVGVSVATSAQSLPGTSKERTRHRKGSSSHEKRLRAKYSSRLSVEQISGQSSLSSSGAKRSSERTPCVSTASNVPTTFENPPATSREPTKHFSGSSTGAISKSSSRLTVEQRFGQIKLDDFETKQTDEKKSSVEQVSGQSSLSSSGAKRSSKKSPSVLTAPSVPTTFENLPGTSREPTKHFSGSSTGAISKSSLMSSVGQRFGQIKLDDFETKQADEKKSSFSTVFHVPKPLQSDSGESHKELTIQPRRSSDLQKPKSSLGSSLKQGLEQPRLPPLVTESERNPSLPVASNVPSATPDLSGTIREPETQRPRRLSRLQQSESSLGSNKDQASAHVRLESHHLENISFLVQAVEKRCKMMAELLGESKDEKTKSSSGEEEE